MQKSSPFKVVKYQLFTNHSAKWDTSKTGATAQHCKINPQFHPFALNPAKPVAALPVRRVKQSDFIFHRLHPSNSLIRL